jgi:site-specific recombinase XerD
MAEQSLRKRKARLSQPTKGEPDLREPKMSTIAQTIVSFLVDRKAQGLSPNTIKAYTNELDIFQNYTDPNQDICNLKATTIREYILHLKDVAGRNPGGCHIAYRVLRTWLYWWEMETDNEFKAPIRKVKPPRVKDEPLQAVDLPDVKVLLNNCDATYQGVRDRAVILLLLDTGLRAAELLNLNRVDLDLDRGILQVHNGKGGKSRLAYFQPLTRRALRKWLNLNDNRPLFVSYQGTRLLYAGLRTMLQRRASRAGLDKVTPHMFRRSFALEHLRAGTDIYTLSRLMGHADERILSRYLPLVALDMESAHRRNSPVNLL